MVMEGFNEHKRWNRRKRNEDNSVPESKEREKNQEVRGQYHWGGDGFVVLIDSVVS